MAPAADETATAAVDLRQHPIRELVATRELLRNLTVREIKVRYKRSALGFLWTLLNPLLMMAVFTIVFSKFLKVEVRWFPIYFLSGYLPFAFFQASCQIATGSIVGNANLVRKVYFSRAVLPLSVVLSQLVHFVLGLAVLLVAEVVISLASGDMFNWWWYLPVLVVATALLTIFTTGLSLLLSAANTYLRDIQEFTTVAFLLWFYATPVIYPMSLVSSQTLQFLLKLNPLTQYVALYRSALYDNQMPGLSTLGAATLSSFVMLAIGWYAFGKLSVQFAKEV